jgi:polysaccharide biosynthesis PFTS motif protein
MKNTKIIFYELHPLNTWLALIISIFFDVVYWRSSAMPKWMLSRFEQICQHGSFTQGEWATKTAPIFFDLKKIFPVTTYKKRVFFQYKEDTIDVTNAAMQIAVMKYERVKHFYCLIGYWLSRQSKDTKYFVVDLLENKNLDDIDLSARDERYPAINLLNSYLDRLWDGLLIILQLGSQIRYFFSSNSSPKYDYSKQNIKFYWRCLTYNEIASETESLDVTSIISKSALNPYESILILPIVPSSKQKLQLSKSKVNWVCQKDVCKFSNKGLLDMFLLLKIVFGFKIFLGEKALIRQIKVPLIRRFFTLNHFIETGASTLVSGQSSGLQESPIVSIVRALNKKTVWWSYSGLGAKSYPDLKLNQFSYEQIEASITLSEKKFVWSKLDRDILLARNLTPLNEEQTRLIVTGPLMSGDPAWAALEPNEARQKYKGFNGSKNCKLWITIFDQPVHRHDFPIEGRWPAELITENIEKKFFKDIGLLLEKYQNIGIIYKPKRSEKKDFLESSEKLELFTNKSSAFVSNRIVKLHYNTDPYIAGSLGDVTIAMPYTSSLLSSIASQKDGVFYDPISSLGSAYPKIMNSITLSSFEELADRIELWLNGKTSINRMLLKKLEYRENPIELFTSLL